jgi:hypothetical protein
MLSIICGLVLSVLSVGAFWYLLPVNGQENPLVENTVIGSMVTIIIMCTLTVGMALFFNGFGGLGHWTL